MSHFIRKLIAVLLAIWLPLSSGSALAVSVSMQMSGVIMQDETMSHEACHDMDGQKNDQTGHHSCADCGVCHLACSGYLGVQKILHPEILSPTPTATPYLFSYHSITSTPLVPPPLA